MMKTTGNTKEAVFCRNGAPVLNYERGWTFTAKIFTTTIRSEGLKRRFLTIRHNKVGSVCEMAEQGHSRDHL